MTVATSTEANVEQAVPFFGVHDIEKSLRFYTEGLGFRKTIGWSPEGTLRWCWLELDKVAVMLQQFWKSEHFTPPTGKLGLGMSICFTCKDAIALYKEFKSRGINAKKPFVGNGMWVTQVTDPDGYELYFESPTDAAEESEFSEDA